GDLGFGGTATANASATNGGSAVAQATGGNSDIGFFSQQQGGAATANASATNGGSAVAQATGGKTVSSVDSLISGDATATSTASGTANATATATAASANAIATSNGGSADATANATGAFLLRNAANATAISQGGPASATANAAGLSNANSFATTINGNPAQAQSTAGGPPTFSGQAQATAQTNFGNFTSVQAKAATSPGGGPSTAIAQAGGIVSPSNPIISGQNFSVVSGAGFGPLTVTNGSMGAGFGSSFGGLSLTYQESATFTQSGGIFVLDLLSSNALGNGFDSALFTISLNSAVFESQSFTDLA